MKRCPECQFLYEDEQELCDMDGTVLRTTSFLPPLARPQPIERNGRPSIWGGLAILLLALVVIGSVLVTLYRATPAKSSSSSVPQNQPAGTNQDTKLPVSDSPQPVTTPAIPAKTTDPFALPETRPQDAAANSSRPVPSTNEKRITIEPATRDPLAAPSVVVNAPKAAPSQTSPAAPTSQKTVTGSKTIAVHPEPPPAKPAPQSKTQNQDKDSKVKSLFKKAGRVLKRPF
jgi:hypothetical protein